MLIPNKYEDLSHSVLAVGSEITTLLNQRRDIYRLYKLLLKKQNADYELSFDRYLLILDFLYAINIINLQGGEVSLIK